jgi:hypothetical protein
MNYYVEIKKDGEHNIDFFDTKRELVRWVAEETHLTQREVREEIEARDNSTIYRDSKGLRVFVTYR